MSIRTLVQLEKHQFRDEYISLRVASEPVTSFNSEVHAAIADLIDTLKSHKIAVGLAGPQIGIPLRISVINISKGKTGPTLVLVNPKIVESSRQTELKHESCMSLPHVKGKVDRPLKIRVTFLDEHEKPQTLRAEGFLARVICHEVDHLDGVLYVDRMSGSSELEASDIF
jgi:peptide deformylase